MFFAPTGQPTLVPVDFNTIPLEAVLDTLTTVVPVDQEQVKAARAQHPTLKLWDLVDVGIIIDRNKRLESMAVVYSPLLMGKTLQIDSEEVMFTVLDSVNVVHTSTRVGPLTWDLMENEYQLGYDDHECTDKLQEAFERWRALRQHQAISAHLPQSTRSKKSKKI